MRKYALATLLSLASCQNSVDIPRQGIHRFYQDGSLETKKNHLTPYQRQLLDDNWYYEMLKEINNPFRLIPNSAHKTISKNKRRIA